ncbi:MAG: mandelate racemase [Rhodospirillales bacterium]|nr:mandelate racemase [Rhodospirillales bacterium]
MTDAPTLKLESVERFERDVTLRLPFRFGVITVTRSTQAVIRATISLPDGRRSTGVAAESLGAKWFDKNPSYSDAQNLDQLRQALDVAIGLYKARGWSTAFGLYAGTYREQLARGAALDLVPLVASYGPALLDRAILDALGRALGLSFDAMIRANVPGVTVTDLTPDLAGWDVPRFLDALRPGDAIAVRHTVGLVDPIVAADQKPDERVGDGLPETLEEVVRHYGGRHYKLKVQGDVAADIDRLSRIAAVLDRDAGVYVATLDGNEQYDSVDGVAELWRRMRETPALRRLVDAILFIEQPIKRAVALSRPVDALARERPLIVDESDGELDTFPAARALGYAGVSSKNCKGYYKSILNAARVAKLNAEAGAARFFMSAEDLTTLAGVSVQQDLALVSLLGMTHVERNGHHFIDGMSFAPAAEQRSFAAAHPDLYDMSGGVARLRIEGGALRLGSLRCPGFAVAGETDFAALRAMAPAPSGRIAPANPGGKP